MKVFCQRGFISPVLLIVLLIIGLVIGLKLVGTPQIFQTQAESNPVSLWRADGKELAIVDRLLTTKSPIIKVELHPQAINNSWWPPFTRRPVKNTKSAQEYFPDLPKLSDGSGQRLTITGPDCTKVMLDENAPFTTGEQCERSPGIGVSYLGFNCTDGTENIIGADSSCKFIEEWKDVANQTCQSRSICAAPIPNPDKSVHPLIYMLSEQPIVPGQLSGVVYGKFENEEYLSTNFTFKDLTPGPKKLYTIFIFSNGKVEEVERSLRYDPDLAESLPGPISLKAYCLSGTQVALSWDSSVASNINSPTTKHLLRVDNSSRGGWNGDCDSPHSPHDFCKDLDSSQDFQFGVEAGDKYHFWVHAGYANGEFSDASENITFSCPAAKDPEPRTSCIQVITPACSVKDPTICESFPTPCDVPDDWTPLPRGGPIMPVPYPSTP